MQIASFGGTSQTIGQAVVSRVTNDFHVHCKTSERATRPKVSPMELALQPRVVWFVEACGHAETAGACGSLWSAGCQPHFGSCGKNIQSGADTRALKGR